MGDEVKPDANSWVEAEEGTNNSSVAAPPATPRAPPKPADDRWSATPKTPGAGAAPPTPVGVEMGGSSAPGTGAKPMKTEGWNGVRHTEGMGKISLLNRLRGGITSMFQGKKQTASVNAAAPEETAVELELSPLKPTRIVPLGATAVPFKVMGSPNAKGGSRKSKSRKFRVKKAKKSRKTKKSRKNQQTRKSRR